MYISSQLRDSLLLIQMIHNNNNIPIKADIVGVLYRNYGSIQEQEKPSLCSPK